MKRVGCIRKPCLQKIKMMCRNRTIERTSEPKTYTFMLSHHHQDADLGSNFSRFTPPSYRMDATDNFADHQVTRLQVRTQASAENEVNKQLDATFKNTQKSLKSQQTLEIRGPTEEHCTIISSPTNRCQSRVVSQCLADNGERYWSLSRLQDWAETASVELLNPDRNSSSLGPLEYVDTPQTPASHDGNTQYTLDVAALIIKLEKVVMQITQNEHSD